MESKAETARRKSLMPDRVAANGSTGIFRRVSHSDGKVRFTY